MDVTLLSYFLDFKDEHTFVVLLSGSHVEHNFVDLLSGFQSWTWLCWVTFWVSKLNKHLLCYYLSFKLDVTLLRYFLDFKVEHNFVELLSGFRSSGIVSLRFMCNIPFRCPGPYADWDCFLPECFPQRCFPLVCFVQNVSFCRDQTHECTPKLSRFHGPEKEPCKI